MDTTLKKQRLWLYLSVILSDVCESWKDEAKSHSDVGHVT